MASRISLVASVALEAAETSRGGAFLWARPAALRVSAPQAEDLPWRGASGAHRGTRARGAAAAISSRLAPGPAARLAWQRPQHMVRSFGRGFLGIFGCRCTARVSDPVSPTGEVCGVQPRGVADYVAWCACASVVIATRTVSALPVPCRLGPSQRTHSPCGSSRGLCASRGVRGLFD